jgi:DNA-binding LacI/PurR family transcriptional regulator
LADERPDAPAAPSPGREPLHRRLERVLRDEIGSGALGAGARLPSEPELSRRYGISRATVRQAVASLAAAGLVRREPGRGTFVVGGAPAAASGPAVLGLVIAGLHGMFLAQMLDGLRRAAGQAGVAMTLAAAELAPGQEEAALAQVRAQGAAGAVVVPSPACATPAAVYRRLQAAGFPLVFLDRCPPGVDAPAVTSDNVGGARLLARHLLRLGHRSFGYVLSREYAASAAAERLEATAECLAEADLPPSALRTVRVGGAPSEALAPYVRAAADGLLASGEPPSAILCTNDDVAIGVLAALREHGLRVPEDAALAGFDDLPFSALVDPPLTTVRQFAAEMGARATGLLLALVHEGRTAGPRVVLPVELCIRRSTAGVPGMPPPAPNSKPGH